MPAGLPPTMPRIRSVSLLRQNRNRSDHVLTFPPFFSSSMSRSAHRPASYPDIGIRSSSPFDAQLETRQVLCVSATPLDFLIAGTSEPPPSSPETRTFLLDGLLPASV